MIELITGKRIGVLSILDEELIIPGGSDAGFLGKLGEEQVGVLTPSRSLFSCFPLDLSLSQMF